MIIRTFLYTRLSSRISLLSAYWNTTTNNNINNTTPCFFLSTQTFRQPCLFDSHSYANMLQRTIQNRDANAGKRVHCDALKRGACLDLFAQNILLNAYVQSESLDDASKLFDEMPLRNTISYVTLAQGYSRSQQFDHALHLVRRLLHYSLVSLVSVSYEKL